MNELSIPAEVKHTTAVSIFTDFENFNNWQRIAKTISTSELVPAQYSGGSPKAIANCMIALDLSNRMKVNPFVIMQNLDIIQGKPAFNSKFKNGMVEETGRYTKFKYEREDLGSKTASYEWYDKKSGTKKTINVKIDDQRVRAYCKELETGDILYGPWVSMEMAVAEGWYTKAGSKWKTMPEVMLNYRAISFWCSLHEPGITLGIATREEVMDSEVIDITPAPKNVVSKLNELPEEPGEIVIINPEDSEEDDTGEPDQPGLDHTDDDDPEFI